ncbi:hypothetical protein [Radiobacillus deserti]|nr:hypothetical protein [Radiobacillus deserti]
MKQNKNNVDTNVRFNVSGTNPQKVKQDIRKDVSRGEGAMTSREAGAMRD